MKIRIQGNKLRFRLKQFEVEQFRKNGNVKEVMSFGPENQQKLEFIITKGNDNQFTIKQAGTHIELIIPATVAEEWTTTAMVGIEEEITTVHGGKITALVEKDFECIDGKVEDNIGTYPNPRTKHSS